MGLVVFADILWQNLEADAVVGLKGDVQRQALDIIPVDIARGSSQGEICFEAVRVLLDAAPKIARAHSLGVHSKGILDVGNDILSNVSRSWDGKDRMIRADGRGDRSYLPSMRLENSPGQSWEQGGPEEVRSGDKQGHDKKGQARVSQPLSDLATATLESEKQTSKAEQQEEESKIGWGVVSADVGT